MKKTTPFFKLGGFIYRQRILITILWALIVLACLPSLPNLVTPFKTTGFVDETSSSVKLDHFLESKFSYGKEKLLISYYSKNLQATNPLFIKKIKKSLDEMDDFPIKQEITYPDMDKDLISKDKHTALVIISFKSSKPLTVKELTLFKSLINPPGNMTIKLGGEPIFISDINKQTQQDLYKADLFAVPITVIILILIFGSVVAALVPLFLGGVCAVTILTSLYYLGHVCTLSIFTINIALLLGLCLTLDYSLFIISRFREESRKNNPIETIIAMTMSTAGKAVFFSGLAVFISLSVLLFFPINILFSVGVGGLAAVFFAVVISLVLLPAILGLLQNKINLLPVRFLKSKNANNSRFWPWLATKVVNRPLTFFIFILMLLLFLGYPFFKVKLGISDLHILPAHTESRDFFDNYTAKFNQNELTPITVVVTSPKDKILSSDSLNKLYDLAKKIKKNPDVLKVKSIVTTNKDLTKAQYYQLYKTQAKSSAAIKQLLKSTTRDHFTVMYVVSKHPVNSAKTKALIKTLQTMKPGSGLTIQLTGIPVNNAEVLTKLATLFPYALIWIMGLTYLILLILLRSLFLPLKAILMNIISLSASYGVLVFIFQEGYLHELLNFHPQGMLDTSLLIIIFCALFGFSMDYEVFLLSRIKEYYEKFADNKKSIIYGIDKSSRIITCAAIIVIFLCGSFMVADVLMVKEFGLGIAVAIFVDAFLVRGILVPSTMALLKSWNWYLPRWLDKILPK